MPNVDTTFQARVRQELIDNARKFKTVFIEYEYSIHSRSFKNRPSYTINSTEFNFLHLTGVTTILPKFDFFLKCMDGSLLETDFSVGDKRQKGTVRRKLTVFPDLLTIFTSNTILAEESFIKNCVSCVLATASNTCTVGFAGKSTLYPQTLLKGFELNKSNSVPVDRVMRKKRSEPQFTEIIYQTIPNP